MLTPLPCPTCKTADEVTVWDSSGWGDYIVTCTNCYDADSVGDPPRYVSTSLAAYGCDRDEAIASWNELVEDESNTEKGAA
jgi:hypothetical protein